MPLPSSGAISLNQIHVEAGGTSGTQCSINDSDIRALINLGSTTAPKMFSSWYGASATIGQIASGNSSYNPGSQYLAANWGLYSTDQDGISVVIFPYVTNHPNFTLNSRSTRFVQMSWQGNVISFVLADKGQVPVTSNNGHPANSGWTSVTLSGNSQTRTLNRTAGTFSTSTISLGGSVHSQSRWQWSGQTNPFPNSANSTSFTVSLA